MKPYEIDTRLKIAIVGKPNVGKSSLTNALLGFDRSIVTDIRVLLVIAWTLYLSITVRIVLLDTAGLKKKAKVQENIEFYSNVRTNRSLMDSDIAVVL
jgi:GTP-binding protein